MREGFISDLRHVHKDVAEEMIRVNKQAATTGEGFVYGQLIVLGHSEYRLFEGSWLPYGPANQKFVLYRRKIANGIRISSCDTTESDSLEYPMMMDDLDDDVSYFDIYRIKPLSIIIATVLTTEWTHDRCLQQFRILHRSTLRSFPTRSRFAVDK